LAPCWTFFPVGLSPFKNLSPWELLLWDLILWDLPLLDFFLWDLPLLGFSLWNILGPLLDFPLCDASLQNLSPWELLLWDLIMLWHLSMLDFPLWDLSLLNFPLWDFLGPLLDFTFPYVICPCKTFPHGNFSFGT